MTRTILLVVISALPLLAAAQQTIWRCGSSYSALPCAEGRALEAPQARPDADVVAAKEAAQRDKRLADQLRDERLRAEAAASRQGAAGIYASASISKAAAVAPRTPTKKRASRSSGRPEEDGTLRAAVPASRRAKG